MPTPFVGKVFTFPQPDGSTLQVRGWGNQYQAVFEPLNGAPPAATLAGSVTPSMTGKSTLVRGGTRWETRRKQAQAMLGRARTAAAPAPPQRGTVGDFVGLCLLIQFPDVPGTISQGAVAEFCNKPGYDGFGNNGSVYDYFLDVSAGKLRYTNMVAPYYTARHKRAYYTDAGVAQPLRARELVEEALAHLRAGGFDFSALSADADGYVYATNVLYAGARVNAWGQGLWPHAHYLAAPSTLPSGAHVYDYQVTEMGEALSLGTFCHENGHMICDFPDLYDYGNQSAGVGAFCLMCTGGNIDEKNPTDINAYLKYRAGWATSVTTMRAGLRATAEAGKNAFYIHRKNDTEYFIVENRQKQGRDLALPADGLAVWHIDELGDNQNEHMTAALHYECSIVQADGRNDLEHDFRNQGDSDDLFRAGGNVHFGDATRPHSKWWDGTPSGLDLSAIGASGPVMQFDCMAVAAAPMLALDPDERVTWVNTQVKEAIRSLCPPDTVVMRATLLGAAGLAHSADKRMQYYTPIRNRLAERGGRIPTLSPESFTAASLKTVGHVCDLVNAALVEGNN